MLLLFSNRSRNRQSNSYIASHYLLYDKFTTNLAAGAVNGTLAEPVGGERTVTDTGTVISTSGGKLSDSGGASVWGSATDAYSSITRALGRVLISELTVSSNNGPMAGFATTKTLGSDSTLIRAAIYIRISTNVINVQSGGVSAITVGASVSGVKYNIAIVLRSSGFFAFIKGGTFSNWKMLYVSTADSTATLFHGIFNFSAAYTADNIRIPKRLFIPAPLQSDGFSGATTDGAGNAENNGPVGNAWTGATWAVAAGAVTNTPSLGADVVVNGTFTTDTDWTKGAGWTIAAGVAAAIAASSDLTAAVAPLILGAWYQIVYDLSGFGAGAVAAVIGAGVGPTHAANATYTETNRATSTALAMRGAGFTGSIDNVVVKALTLSELIRSISASSANILADVSITRTAGTQSGLIVNLDSAATPANFVVAYLDGNGNAKLDKCVAGVYTNVISAAVTYSAGAVLRVIKDGTSYRLFYGNLAVGSVSTISDAGIISNTLHGLFSTYSGNSFDNFCVWARGAENQYSALDYM